MEIKSEHLKTAALSKLRFKNQCHCIATEVGPYLADVMGVNERMVYEIEVKISRADLRNDFKKLKHVHYAKPMEGLHWTIPHKFFFAVPVELAQYAIELCEDLQPKYGVMSFNARSCILDTVRQAKKLHDKKPSVRINQTLLKRMGSELARFHIKNMNDDRFEVIGD